MCARYVLINGKMVLESFLSMHIGDIRKVFGDLPRYNATPFQKMPVVAFRDGQLTVQKMKWWLVPGWSRDGKIKATTFNAKAETLDKSRLYYPYFKSNRCLIPADAFYEWQKIDRSANKSAIKDRRYEKQPICIRMKKRNTFMFAGLYSVWKNDRGDEFPSFTVITTIPNELIEKIHHRMPVILSEKNYDQWLDADYKETDKLKKLLVPFAAAKMEAFPVSKYVSNSKNEGPECMDPI